MTNLAEWKIVCQEIDGSESIFEDNIKLRKLILEKEEKLSKFLHMWDNLFTCWWFSRPGLCQNYDNMKQNLYVWGELFSWNLFFISAFFLNNIKYRIATSKWPHFHIIVSREWESYKCAQDEDKWLAQPLVKCRSCGSGWSGSWKTREGDRQHAKEKWTA